LTLIKIMPGIDNFVFEIFVFEIILRQYSLQPLRLAEHPTLIYQ